MKNDGKYGNLNVINHGFYRIWLVHCLQQRQWNGIPENSFNIYKEVKNFMKVKVF